MIRLPRHFRLAPAAALALAISLALPVAGRAEIKVEPWTPIFQGVELAHGSADAAEPKLQQVIAIRIDLQARGIEFFSTPAGGHPPMETLSETPSDFLAHYHLQIALNANFYAPCCTPGEKNLDGLAISRGTVVSPAVAKGTGAKAFVVTLDNRAAIVATGEDFAPDQYWTAVAGSEIVLAHGQKPVLSETKLNQETHPRSVVGLTADGRYVILLAIDGRQPGYSMGATISEVGDWLLRFGASDGLNLDGGGSTALIRDRDGQPEVLNRPSGVALGSSDNAGKAEGERQQRSNGNNFGIFALPLKK